jgi:galactokinase
MPKAAQIIAALATPAAAGILASLYGDNPSELARQRQRYSHLVLRFASLFPQAADIQLFSASGRSEVGGNHTDHNAGRVLAAAVNLDLIAAVSKTDLPQITIHSEGFPPSTIDLSELNVIESEKYTFTSVVRGVCARLVALGYTIGGFDACMTSDVLKGSGLSSSASFEVLVAQILNDLYNQGQIDAITLAKIGQFAENRYFGKPSGLMDQTTSAVGGFVTIDFRDESSPVVKKVAYNFAASGLSLVIVDTGGSHADLNEEYAAIANEMKAVAHALGGKVMRDFSAADVMKNLVYLRSQVNDRAILRALHFLADDLRVVAEVDALEQNDTPRFLDLVVESGYSSWMLLQNCYSIKDFASQGLTLALAISERLLKGRGAWRVHGGGFAGTIQAFVPTDLLEGYVDQMCAIFGAASCHILSIRQVGATRVDID